MSQQDGAKNSTLPIVYGAAGSGSVAVEAALTLLDIDYRLIEGATWQDDLARDRVSAANGMRQIPTVVLPAHRARLFWAARFPFDEGWDD